jgi:transcriptional regulator with XRE-family HTH domain
MHMTDKHDPIIATLKIRQRRDGLTQIALASVLGVHQGHLSKVMSGKAPLSAKLRAKIERLFQDGASNNSSPSDFELELIQTVRSSSAFRSLVRAAMQLHRRRG